MMVVAVRQLPVHQAFLRILEDPGMAGATVTEAVNEAFLVPIGPQPILLHSMRSVIPQPSAMPH